MGRSDTDRNLLFGALALQLDLIGPGQLAEACESWAGGRDGRLSDVLCERGWLSHEDRDDLQRLLERKLERHGADAHRILASVADDRLAASLAGVAAPEIRVVLDELGAAPDGVSPDATTLDWPAGSRAHYPLVRLHAKGGLGRVWQARDTVLGRAVALKEILPERADDPTYRARFLAEARITGQLEHPSIVPVYELSSRAEDGRPFYTMRMIRGRTLSAAVRAHHARSEPCRGDMLELSGLLNAFVAVCNAIAYAHARGVIHRDLKGQNIILGDFGEAIVLDWGLAKVIDRPDGDWPEAAVAIEPGAVAMSTLPGQPMGTPGYMAPEQADGRQDLVGRATDIYGLGAVLYEILTGKPPFDTAATPEAVRQVCERDPDPPGRVCTATPPALEAICLKALSRRPGDRYASATELAGDVRRWLADEPVSAYREPMTAAWARWARRHRSAVIVACGLMLVGLAALGVGIVLIGRERTRSQRHFRLARDEADRIYYRILGDPLLNRPGLDPLRSEIIAGVQQYYRRLAAARPDDPELAEHLGWSYLRLARITLQLGSPESAIDQARLALGIFEGLARDHPSNASYRGEVAHALIDMGQIDQSSGRLTEAESSFAASLEIWRELSRAGGGRTNRFELATACDLLAGVDLGLGRTDRALALHTEALAIWEALARPGGGRAPRRDDLSRLASCRASLGALRVARKEWEEAEGSYLQAREIWEGLLRQGPGDAESSRLGYALQGLGKVYEATGRTEEARETFETALAIWDRMAAEHPAIGEYAEDQAAVHIALGELDDPSLHPPGDPGRAEGHYRRSLEILEKPATVQPQGRDRSRAGRARALTHLGQLYRSLGKTDLAETYLRRARDARADGVRRDGEPRNR